MGGLYDSSTDAGAGDLGLYRGNSHRVSVPPGELAGALSYADNDGGQAVHFLPPHLLGDVFVMPQEADYVAFAAEAPVSGIWMVSQTILNSNFCAH